MYLNKQIHNAADLGLTPEDMGAWYDDLWSGAKSVAKSGSDIYQANKAAAQTGYMQQQQQAAQQYAAAPAGGGFLQKHGLKLAIGAGGLLVLFLVLKKKG